MITKPTASPEESSIEALLAEQRRLHDQADKLLATSGLAEIFQTAGTLAPIGGSYRYGLLVYPDLDMNIISPVLTRETVAQLSATLMANPTVRKLSFVDTITFPANPVRPKGYWLGIEIHFEGDKWGIDLWLQQPDWKSDVEDRFAEELMAIDEPTRNVILTIKHDLIVQGVYGEAFQSIDVYDAVLNKNVRTTEDFLLLLA